MLQPCTLVLKNLFLSLTDRNQTYQNGRLSNHSDVERGSANRQTSFSGRGNAWIKLTFYTWIKRTLPTSSEDPPFSAEHRRPHCKQDKCSSSPRSAVWGTRHPTTGHSLHWCREVGTSKLPTSWVFSKQEAWPCHVCPRATKIHAFGPISTDIGDWVVVCGRWWL